MKIPRCKVHDMALICPACVGAKGGRKTSRAKAACSRANGKLGGRPRKTRAKRGR